MASYSTQLRAVTSSENGATFSWDALPRRKPTDRKRTWGIFYTPNDLSRCLAEWAVRNRKDTVLEPSFGGCGFLNESARILKELGSFWPWRQLCGCDKDLRAFVHLPKKYRRIPNRRFLHRNFLDTEPSEYYHKQFSVLIGNPPFVSRHNMRKYQLNSVDKVHEENDVRISLRSSLWVYFIIHSLRFLREGGRMAWVLPRSLSQADYGHELVDLLCGRFASVTIISVQKRFFVTDGADELIDVLLCTGFCKSSSGKIHPIVTYADTVEQLKEKINAKPVQPCTLPVEISSGREELLTTNERSAINSFGQAIGYRTLGDIAEVNIGIVTGMTRYFVLNRAKIQEANLSEEMCVPLLTRAKQAKGLAWQAADVQQLVRSDHSILLVRSDIAATEQYWAKMPKDVLASNVTFRRREKKHEPQKWYEADDKKIPDAFFMALVANGPRFILNDACTNCNNSIYRIFLKDKLDELQKRLLSILFVSSFVQVSGEMIGRICGAGGLKFEPSDALKLKIFYPTEALRSLRIEELWPEIDILLRNGLEREAVERVDHELLSVVADKISQETISHVHAALKKLRVARKPSPRIQIV